MTPEDLLESLRRSALKEQAQITNNRHTAPHRAPAASIPLPPDDATEEQTVSSTAMPHFSQLAAHTEHRQAKAAVHVLLVWGLTALLHWLEPWGEYAVWLFTVLCVFYLVRLFWYSNSDDQRRDDNFTLPYTPVIHIAVPARNEVAVLPACVASCQAQDYPAWHLHLINDGSTDGTSDYLDTLRFHSNIHIHHLANNRDFKAGALNSILPQLENDSLLLVLNADAVLPEKDALRTAVAYFAHDPNMGAIQFHKQYSNGDFNSWTKSQVSELGLDQTLQEQRSAWARMGELRGSGYMVRVGSIRDPFRTVTEDLELTCQLQCLRGMHVRNVTEPVVSEEAVIGPVALWKQRCRWCEGGFQRHLEYYWPVLFSKTPGVLKWYQWVDLMVIGIVQYALPVISLADFMFSIAMGRFLPIWFPFQCLVTLFGTMFMMKGILRVRKGISIPNLLFQTFCGLLFMGNWFLVVLYTLHRMAFCGMKRQWIKTVHGEWNRASDVEATSSDVESPTSKEANTMQSTDDSVLFGGSTTSESTTPRPDPVA